MWICVFVVGYSSLGHVGSLGFALPGTNICRKKSWDVKINMLECQDYQGILLEEKELWDESVELLLPIPARDYTRNTLYSWAYHKSESLARKSGCMPDDVKHISRVKANEILRIYAEELLAS